LNSKRGKGKRSIRDDEDRLTRLRTWFGAETLVTEITAQRIAQYDRDRVTQQSCPKQRISPMSTITEKRGILNVPGNLA
jgi:hypothetical protein